MKTSIEQTCKYTIILSSQVQVLFEAHTHTDTLTHWKNKKTLTQWHTDTQPHRQTQIALQLITIFFTCVWIISFEKKKPDTKIIFPMDFVLAMLV